ncbi:unnamed protein product [Cylicostephanus goldi]|uniref:Archease domain-containing protein n=1 Tax=Cylicostephanus goldi TaxID=71465 RepID=A0A3P7NFC6_CYLGO|nr:unnamed protein product [Cylicostephanus goldi]
MVQSEVCLAIDSSIISDINCFLGVINVMIPTDRKDRRPDSISDDVADLHLAKRPRHSEEFESAMNYDGMAEQMSEGVTTGDCGYRYLEHPADVQVHAWGPDFAKALAQAEQFTMYYTAQANDLYGLVHAVMEEALCGFQSEPFFVGRRVAMDKLDLKNFTAEFQVGGECFDLHKHPQLTDVKAITYSNMQVHQTAERCDIYVILDI